jgi:hypothetical protein
MKKIIITAIIVIVILNIAAYLIVIKDNQDENSDSSISYQEGNLLDYSTFLSDSIPINGYVPDAIAAQKIAEAILYPIYGKDIKDKKPFLVKFDEENQVWIIEGQLPKNRDGGVPYVIIQKSDGKILAVWHSK